MIIHIDYGVSNRWKQATFDDVDDVEEPALIVKEFAEEGTDAVLFERISGILLVFFLVLGELLQSKLINLSQLSKLLNKSSNFAGLDCTDKNSLLS